MVMNSEYILGELQKRGREGLALLNGKGGTLTQTDMIALGVVAFVGILICFFGLKLVRLWAALMGLALGAVGGSYIASFFSGGYVPLIIGGVAGIILAVLGARFYLAGVFLVEWISGSLVCAYFLKPGDWKPALACAAIGLVLGLAALKLTEPVTMLITGIAGGFLAGQAIYVITAAKNMAVHIAVIAALIILGVVIQVLLESKRRIRQHLKKAEEIRQTHSVANEVERARAMMEELDGEAPARKGKGAKAGKKGAKAAVSKAVSDSSEDDDERSDEVGLEDDDDFQILEFTDDDK